MQAAIALLLVVSLLTPFATDSRAQEEVAPAEPTAVVEATPEPTVEPTEAPVEPTEIPTDVPTELPTDVPPAPSTEPEPVEETPTDVATVGAVIEPETKDEPNATPTLHPTETKPAREASPEVAAASPRISLPRQSFTVGSTVKVTGTYWDTRSSITIMLDGKTVVTTNPGKAGWEKSFRVPPTVAGSHVVTAKQGSRTARATLVVVPSVRVSPADVAVGARVTVNLDGFLAGDTVTVTVLDRIVILKVRVTSTGSSERTIRLASTVKPAKYTVRARSRTATVPRTTLTVKAPAATPSPTATKNATVTATFTATVPPVTATSTATRTVPTSTATATPTATASSTATSIATSTATATATRTATATSIPATATRTATPIGTATSTSTASATPTATATGTRTATATPFPSGSVRITSVDDIGQAVAGPCFQVYTDLGDGTLGNLTGNGCNDDGHQVTIASLRAGSYVVTENRVPYGFNAGPNQRVAVTVGATTQVTFVNVPTTKLIIRNQSETGQPLVGACFAVHKSEGGTRGARVGAELCDSSDGASDAYMDRTLGPGSYWLVYSRPAKGYLPSGT
jgi:hypothetical protein